MEYPLDGSQQKNFHRFASVLVLRSTEEVVQDVGYPLCSIPFQAVQVVPDGMIAALEWSGCALCAGSWRCARSGFR